jgi:RNA polymerase primary sigma factor
MRQFKITPTITGRDSAAVEKYLYEISKEPLISAEEEAELARLARAGDALALEKLIRANLRFVVSVAKQYQHFGINLADLINEGNLGLIKAAQRFDETRGFKFISYAVWWIRQCIHNAISEHGRVIRIPSNQNNYINKINKFSREFEQLNYREPTPEEVSEAIEIDSGKVKDLISVSRKHVSLDEPLVDGEEGSLLDLICNNNLPEADNELIKESLSFEINRSLNFLLPKEKEILSLYFGIDKPGALTIEEISELLNISKERVRQVKEKAIRKLRNRFRSKNLQQFLG